MSFNSVLNLSRFHEIMKIYFDYQVVTDVSVEIAEKNEPQAVSTVWMIRLLTMRKLGRRLAGVISNTKGAHEEAIPEDCSQ